MARNFLDDNFFLYNRTAERLYHEFAEHQPIIDYHNHLPAMQIAGDLQFENLTQIWLNGDHYKWRAMRSNGVSEKFCTGDADDFAKFERWAETVPYTVRNPLYHWTHLELKRYFGIEDILSAKTASKVYESCNHALQTPQFSVKNLLSKMNVKILCTTDDPLDSLEAHCVLKEKNFAIKILPTFRPDRAMEVDCNENFLAFLHDLEIVENISISNFDDYLTGLKHRHDHFDKMGCKASDHGLPYAYAQPYTESGVQKIFTKLLERRSISPEESLQIKSALLFHFATWNWEKGWVQQFHLGSLRDVNKRMTKNIGPATGWDSIGDYHQAIPLGNFLERLDSADTLAKTILYNLNPSDNELMATMAGNFNDGEIQGKVHWGAAWWFLDQKDGMIKHLNALSNAGLLSRFLGMVTDSRSFLSFPRHEYFRRILCNLLGQEMEEGELPNDISWIGSLVNDICYYNVKNYFNW